MQRRYSERLIWFKVFKVVALAAAVERLFKQACQTHRAPYFAAVLLEKVTSARECAATAVTALWSEVVASAGAAKVRGPARGSSISLHLGNPAML